MSVGLKGVALWMSYAALLNCSVMSMKGFDGQAGRDGCAADVVAQAVGGGSANADLPPQSERYLSEVMTILDRTYHSDAHYRDFNGIL